MKNIQSRLQRLEPDNPIDSFDAQIRAAVETLTLEEARFCLWVLCDGDEDTKNPTDHPDPTKADRKRAGKLLNVRLM